MNDLSHFFVYFKLGNYKEASVGSTSGGTTITQSGLKSKVFNFSNTTSFVKDNGVSILLLLLSIFLSSLAKLYNAKGTI